MWRALRSKVTVILLCERAQLHQPQAHLRNAQAVPWGAAGRSAGSRRPCTQHCPVGVCAVLHCDSLAPVLCATSAESIRACSCNTAHATRLLAVATLCLLLCSPAGVGAPQLVAAGPLAQSCERTACMAAGNAQQGRHGKKGSRCSGLVPTWCSRSGTMCGAAGMTERWNKRR